MVKDRETIVYRTVAFTAGFVLMTFELVAARMLAPTIGTSIFVWTNVLGVIMAALALGYWLGGRLADKRKEDMDIVWLLFAVVASIIFVLVAGSSIIELGLVFFRDARWQGLFVATFLFAAPSLLLGMTSPYLAKLAVSSTKTTGNAVAGLSTANAIGSILGTFATGFILFGLIGGYTILLALIILTIVASWLVAPKELWKLRVAVSGLAVIIALVAVLQPADTRGRVIDTAAARYVVHEGLWRDGREVRMLITGPRGAQSAVYTDGSNDLVFWYKQQVSALLRRLHEEDAEFRVLILGGGAFTLPDYLARNFPKARIDVVEIDPELFDIAQRYFGVEDHANMHIYAEDARSFVNRGGDGKLYDFVLVGVSHDIALPWQFATKEFGEAVAQILARDGVAVVNLIAAEEGGCARIYEAVYGAYAQYFRYRYLTRDNVAPDEIANSVMVFAREPKPELGLRRLDKEIGRVYTDRFAPIEHLLLQCHR